MSEFGKQADAAEGIDANTAASKIADLFGDGDLDETIPTDEDYVEPEDEESEGDDEDLETEDDEDDDTEEDDPEEGDDSDDEDDSELEDDEDGLDDDEDEEDDSETPGEAETYTIKVDGEEIEVTLEEALQGYQRQSAFTRKTQELAQERNDLASARQELQQLRQEYTNNLQVVQQALVAASGEERDWEALQAEDPDGFAREWAAHQRRQQQLAAVQGEIDKANQQAMKDQQEALAQIQQNEFQALVTELPSWGTDESKEERQRVAQYASERFGWTEEMLRSLPDHRIILMLRESMLYRDLMEQKPTLKGKQRKPKGKTLKPGRSKSPKERDTAKSKAKSQKLRDRVRKSGRIDDAAQAIFESDLEL